MAKSQLPTKIRVGERFTRYLGHTPVEVVVIEDRGNLGVDGGQVVRIREVAAGPYDEEREYEIPAKDIPAMAVPPAPPPPRRRKSLGAVPTATRRV